MHCYLWQPYCFFKVNILLNPASPPETFTYRRVKSIDYSKCISDFNASPLIETPPNALTTLFWFLLFYPPVTTWLLGATSHQNQPLFLLASLTIKKYLTFAFSISLPPSTPLALLSYSIVFSILLHRFGISVSNPTQTQHYNMYYTQFKILRQYL